MSDPTARDVDVVVVGAGIVGLATAVALLERDPGRDVAVLEKEPQIATHQTGRNSGVVHSGIYYRPGSAKAELVGRGRRLLEDRCRERGIDFELCGKVIVATEDRELAGLARLEQLAAEHGLTTRRLDPPSLREREPHAKGIAALEVPAAGIVDFGGVCDSLAADLTEPVRVGTAVRGIREHTAGVDVDLDTGVLRARSLVNCAGLHSDRIAAMTQAPTEVAIVPFRGEYHELVPASRDLVRHLIYPVPDPAFPFLGVHFTRMVDGNVHAGPNAVLALAREGYRWRDVETEEVGELLRLPGMRHLARRHWRTGIGEVTRSLSTAAFTKALQRLVPDVGRADLRRSAAGVRAQALAPDGSLLDDFAFARTARTVHVLNAPSPAATASLAIGEEIARRVDHGD